MRVRGPAILLVLLAMSLPAVAQDASPPQLQGETIWLPAATHRLKARAFAGRARSDHPQLVVVLHGDSPFRNPTYQYLFARLVAEANADVVAVGLLRPGYSDGEDQSDGRRGRTTGDNYTRDVVDDVAAATGQLKRRFAARSVVLVGHSGGAAIAADTLAVAPDAAAGAVLVSCPCDLSAFRHHMARVQWSPFWLLPVDSLSPLLLVDGIDRGAILRMLVGSDDELTPLRFTQRYADAFRSRGGDVTIEVLPGQPHDILLEPQVFAALTALLRKVDQR